MLYSALIVIAIILMIVLIIRQKDKAKNIIWQENATVINNRFVHAHNSAKSEIIPL